MTAKSRTTGVKDCSSTTRPADQGNEKLIPREYAFARVHAAGASSGATARPVTRLRDLCAVASDPTGAMSLFDAMSRQLGLKLEQQKRPAQVLVIDSIQRTPTEN